MTGIRSFRSAGLFLLLAMVAVLGGCATADVQLKPTYQPVGEAKGPGGQLILASSLEGTVPGVGERIQWILGEVKDSDGKVKGNVTSPTAPSALIRDALQQELLRAGYAVKIDRVVPTHADYALLIKTASVQLNEVSSIVKSDVECKASFAVEIWLKGKKTNTLSFEASRSGITMTDRDKLYNEVFQKAFSAMFGNAVADIVAALKK